MRENKDPKAAIETTANVLGSDTDTISSFLGAMLGAQYGLNGVPTSLASRIQDHDYLLKTGQRIHTIAYQKTGDKTPRKVPIERHEAFLKMMAWDIGLHEMFWDAIAVGGTINHPALGQGTITKKQVKSIPREGYYAKLLSVRFDIGQTCVFHSRVKHDYVAETWAADG